MRTVRSQAFFLAIAATALGCCRQSQENVSQPDAAGFSREWAEVAKLRAQGAEAAAVVPLLVRCLDDEQHRRLEAARLIGEYGPEAKGAVPAIRRHLRGRAQDYGQWPFVCNLLTALGRIGPDARDSVPQLLELLDTKAEHDRRLHAHVIGVLGLIGPDAKAAVPRLMRHVHPESPHHTGALAAVQKITRRKFGEGDEAIQKAQAWWRNEGQGRDW